MKPILGL